LEARKLTLDVDNGVGEVKNVLQVISGKNDEDQIGKADASQ
jgi:hypothetical protein